MKRRSFLFTLVAGGLSSILSEWVTRWFGPWSHPLLVFIAVPLVVGFLAADVQSFLQNRSSLKRAPGSKIRAFCEWTFTPRTCAEVLFPVIADMQHLYFDAVAEGRPYKAHWVRIRSTIFLCSHLVAMVPLSITRLAVTIWKTFS